MRWAWACLLVMSCAAPKPRPQRAPRFLAASSIAAVLQHQSELNLTPEQVEKLLALDERLQALNDEARQRAREKEVAESGPKEPPSSMMGTGASTAGSGAVHRGSRRPGATGSMFQGADAKSKEEALNQTLDENDTSFFLQAEPIWTVEQRPRAFELASQYRAQLYEERRDAAR